MRAGIRAWGLAQQPRAVQLYLLAILVAKYANIRKNRRLGRASARLETMSAGRQTIAVIARSGRKNLRQTSCLRDGTYIRA